MLPAVNGVRYVPPPALWSTIPVTCEPKGILDCDNGDPISGACPSYGITFSPANTANCANIVPELPLLAIVNSGEPIDAPV